MKETQPVLQMPSLTDAEIERADPRVFEALAILNQIGATINRLTPQGDVSIDAILQLIVESAIKLVPGASAAIHTYDVAAQAFGVTARVTAGAPSLLEAIDPSCPDGIGMRALRERRRVLAYEQAAGVSHTCPCAPDRALACFPLIVTNQPVGALYITLRDAQRFSRFELLMLDNLVNQAAMAIYQVRRLAVVQRDLFRTEEALNRLWRAGMLISSRLGLDETLEAILRMALDVTGAHHGIFRLVDGEGRHLVTHAVAGTASRPQVDALPTDVTSVMGWVAMHREPLCIHDLEAAPWVRLYHPLDADLRMRSELAVPLISASGRLEGVLNLESPAVGAFGDQDRHLLQSLATQAVIAIQEARLLDAVLEVARLLLAEPSHVVLQRLAALGADLLNAAVGAIWTLEETDLVLRATTDGWQHSERLPVAQSLVGEAVTRRAPITSEDVRADPRFFRPDLAQGQGWARALVVPLLSSEGGEALGAFGVYDTQKEPGRFIESEWDKKVLTCLAQYAVLTLQSAERQRALKVAQERHAVAETFAAVGDVAANVLHHLNNKVGTIPVRVQGIQDKCVPALRDDDYLATNLAEIEHSAREAMDAVRDSLATLRPIHLAPVTVVDAVRVAVDTAHLAPGIEVRIEDLETLPPVIASHQGLAFVFTNLLANAGAALGERGTICIRGETIDSCVEIAVQDDGPGILPERHSRIFEFEPSGAGSGRHGNLGFGLWWVKTLLVRLGGDIRVQSDGETGTTFYVRLPKAGSDDGI